MAGLKMKALYNQYFCSPSARFYILAFFLAFVFLTGGSSRDDVQSLIILRPAAVIFAAYALTVADFSEWKGRLFPLYILLALAALMVIQLIPLPPSLWTQLPERELFKDIAVLAGIDQPWRPLSIAPSRTLNSLFSLSVPLAALFLYLNLPNEMRFRAIILIMIFILFSALLAIGQIAGPSKNALYLYRITNFNSPVGFFANRNHQASLLAALILLLGWYGGIINAQKLRGNVRAFGAILAIIVILPLIFITGSRAGLILSGAALPAAIWFFFKGLSTMRLMLERRLNRNSSKKDF
ncbi:MAG: hypothetical protein HC843_14105 [Sphingomonadales bacterium]|nr:hypothetical protein [Sphingomonadales bacterium]